MRRISGIWRQRSGEHGSDGTLKEKSLRFLRGRDDGYHGWCLAVTFGCRHPDRQMALSGKALSDHRQGHEDISVPMRIIFGRIISAYKVAKKDTT